MRFRAEVIDTGVFEKFARIPDVLQEKAVGGVQRTLPNVQADMFANAPVLTGEMRSRLTNDGGVVGIFDSEQADVALFNEYSPNHQPFMRHAGQSNISTLEQNVTVGMQEAESELAE